jgi:hypothetical protein
MHSPYRVSPRRRKVKGHKAYRNYKTQSPSQVDSQFDDIDGRGR